MKRSPELSKLIALARTARAHIDLLAREERREVGEDDWQAGRIEGYCGIAAAYLEALANDIGLQPVYCVGEFKTYSRLLGTYKVVSGHAWLKHSGYIIDITANQFVNVVSRVGKDFSKRVYVCRTTNPHFDEMLVGDAAKAAASKWYIEPLEELCDKVRYLSSF